MAWEVPQKPWTDQDETAFQAEHKAELAKAAEQDEVFRESRNFVGFAQDRAVQARKAANEQRAAEWDQAAECVRAGQWPISRTVASDPAITRFQSLRTRFLYAGATKKLG